MDGGKFIKFDNYDFNPLEEATEKERAENIRSFVEASRGLVELGARQEDVFEWLKSFKDFHLDSLTFDMETAGLEDYQDITDDVMAELQSQNEWEESKHPRDKDGKFGKGGSSVKGNKNVESISKEEYGKIIHELNNNLTKEQRKKKRITKAIGNYIYTVINNGFNEYTVVEKAKIDEFD